MDGILASTKKLSGVGELYDHFDVDLLMYINSVFFVLRQLGVGPIEGFVVESDEETWSDFISDDAVLRNATKTYVAAKVRLQFDPPTSSSHIEALTNIIKEYEWRLNVDVES